MAVQSLMEKINKQRNKELDKIMIDTIVIKNYYQNLQNQECLLENAWFNYQKYQSSGWILNPKAGSHLPRLTLSQTPDGIHHLQAEVSIPKMLFGNNIKLPTEPEVWEGLKQISEYVTQKSGLPFDLETAVVNRVDYTKDFNVGEDQVIPIISSLAKKSIPRFDRIYFNDSTVYFKSRGKTQEIKIYSKFHETISNKSNGKDLLNLSRGLLRLEHSFSHRDSLKKLAKDLGYSERKAKYLLRSKVSELVLANDVKILDWSNYQLEADNSQLDYLQRCFTLRRAFLLFGFLELIRQRGENCYKDKMLGLSRNSYYRYAADCRKFGIWK